MLVAAGLGYAAGRMGRPKAANGGDGAVETAILESAFGRLSSPRFALMLRVDAVETWKRTHGMPALDQFVRRLRAAVEAELPQAVDVRTGDAEVTAVCGGEPAQAVRLLTALKDQRFRLPDGTETLVTCSLGVAPEEPGVTLAELRGRASAAVRKAQSAGRWQAFVASSSGTRPLE